MPRIKLYFSYDGTHFQGWQRQKNTAHTIQEVMESKLSRIVNQKTALVASGRTDAGVHARVQVAHADLPDSASRLLGPDRRLVQGLNSILPANIRVLRIDEVASGFHAIRDVQKKTYLYFIDPSPVQWPELRHHSWHLRLPLDWDAIRAATPSLLGTHDFKAFCGKNASSKTSRRTLYEATWGAVPHLGFGARQDLMVLRLTGSGFLKNMVRSIVGTLVQIGNRRAPVSRIQELLESRDRRLAGPTAPARGLWLWDILYLT